MTAPLSTVSVNATPTLIYASQGSASGDSIQVVNQSPTEYVWVGNTSNISPGAGCVPLGPGASASFNGSVSIYAVAVGDPVMVAVMPGGISYSPPPQSYASLLSDYTGHDVSYSGPLSYETGLYNVQPFQSYSLSVTAYSTTPNNIGNPLTMPIQVNWYADAAGTVLLETDTYWMWVASSVFTAISSPFIGGGPARGAYMSLTFLNAGTGVSTVHIRSISINGNARSLPATKFTQSAPGMNSGIQMLTSVNPVMVIGSYPNGTDGIVANEIANGNAYASSEFWFPLPLFTGPVSMRFETSTALGNDFSLALAANLCNGGITPGSSAQGCIWNPASAAGQEYTASLVLPNCPTYAVVKTSTSVPVIGFAITGAPQ